jgi:hypothetical protein
MLKKKVPVQAGVASSKGTAYTPWAGFKVGSQVMPVQPGNKKWVPNWHPLNPRNNQVIT